MDGWMDGWACTFICQYSLPKQMQNSKNNQCRNSVVENVNSFCILLGLPSSKPSIAMKTMVHLWLTYTEASTSSPVHGVGAWLDGVGTEDVRADSGGTGASKPMGIYASSNLGFHPQRTVKECVWSYPKRSFGKLVKKHLYLDCILIITSKT